MRLTPITAALSASILITILFYRQQVGINLLLAEIAILALLYATGKLKRVRNHLIFTAGLVLTGIGAVAVHSDFVIVMNMAGLFILVGKVAYPEARSLLTTLKISSANIFPSQRQFLDGFSGRRPLRLRQFALYAVPLSILLLFVWIYRHSSPEFDQGVTAITSFMSANISRIFAQVDFALPATMLVSLALANFLFLSTRTFQFAHADVSGNDILVRSRPILPGRFRAKGLSAENRMGIFLLVCLNVALLALNITDIYFVWFNFTWDGGYLKQFVHEGTYLLLLSILLSVAIVLYFFRGNLNFFSKSKWLRYLSYAWILQNAVLAISVGVRNYWYIEYFALAYKRIGLLIFLLLTLYGLFTVYKKVRFRKSTFYLLRRNAFALYCVLTVSSLINWDSVIVRYNIAHAGDAFFEFGYMARFPDKTLPQLDKPLIFYQEISRLQGENLGLTDDNMSAEAFYIRQLNRQSEFLKRWESRGWLSWNLPEYLAYTKLSDMPR